MPFMAAAPGGPMPQPAAAQFHRTPRPPLSSRPEFPGMPRPGPVRSWGAVTIPTEAHVIRTYIVSPFRGATPDDRRRNVAYAEACMLDSLARGEAPFAPHLLYPRVLADSMPLDRAAGREAGLAWLAVADVVAVYIDLGITEGMEAERQYAAACVGRPAIEKRSLPSWRTGGPDGCR